MSEGKNNQPRRAACRGNLAYCVRLLDGVDIRDLRSDAQGVGRVVGRERRRSDVPASRRVYRIARRSEGPEVAGGTAARGQSLPETGAARRDGLGIHRFSCRRDPRAHRRPRRRAPRSAEPVRAGRRPPPGRDSNSGDRTAARPCFCGFGLRRRVAVSQGDAEDTPAPRRTSNGDSARPPASRRCAPRLCLRRGCSVRHRQPRPLLGVRLGRRCFARWCSAISSPCSSPVSRWSSAIFCSPPTPSASASFRRVRWPHGSGVDGSPRSSAGLPSAG